MTDSITLDQWMADNVTHHPNSNLGRITRAAGVSRSSEFERIKALPRREVPSIDREMLTRFLKTPSGALALRPRQAYVLSEYHDFGGCLAPMPVGDGKTLVTLLAPVVVGSARPLLLVPANLRKKTLDVDIPEYERHFRMHQNLTVMSYSMLSSDRQAEALYDLMPDDIICDEAHNLRNPKAARTRRFLRYFREYPETRLLALSGSFFRRSLRDFWHLARLTLPRQCPLPLSWNILQDWADALDSDVAEERRIPAGALSDFCEPGEDVRHGFRRRLVQTPGVVASYDTGFEDGEEPDIEIHEVPVDVPPVVVEAFEQLRITWATPSGEEISDAMSLWRNAHNLALGFYQRWIWPNDEPDVEWLQARKVWHRFVRETLKHNRRGLDSELQVFNAVDCVEKTNWVAVKRRYSPTPPTETIWLSDFAAHRAATFENVQLIWTRTPAFGQRIAELAGLPYFGAGDDGILDYGGDRCVLSLRSHGTGKNLQRYSTNFFAQQPFGGDAWQQNMGRTHRSGQAENLVTFYVFMHCKEMWSSFAAALRDAEGAEALLGEPQRLSRANHFVRSVDEAERLINDGHDPLWGV